MRERETRNERERIVWLFNVRYQNEWINIWEENKQNYQLVFYCSKLLYDVDVSFRFEPVYQIDQ